MKGHLLFEESDTVKKVKRLFAVEFVTREPTEV